MSRREWSGKGHPALALDDRFFGFLKHFSGKFTIVRLEMSGPVGANRGQKNATTADDKYRYRQCKYRPVPIFTGSANTGRVPVPAHP